MAETADSVVVASELVSKPQKIAAPRYRWIKQYPMRGAAAFPLAAATRTPVQFEIPTRCINYSRSYLCGTITIPAGGAGVSNWRHADAVSFISAVNFKTRTGATLIDLEYVQNYTQLVNKYETPLEQVLTADESDVVAPFRGYVNTVADAKRPDNKTIVHPNVEIMQCTAGALNTEVKWNFRIPLSRVVPNSVFSRRSDLKLPEIAVLTISFGPSSKAFWRATSATDPAAGVAAIAVNLDMTAYLQLACQEDPVYEAMYDERMRTGFSIPINFPMVSMTPATGAHQSVSVTYNSGHGRRLVKVYHAPYVQPEVQNDAYNHANDDAATKILESYFVKLKGSRTSDEDFKIDPDDPTAYLWHKPLLEETAITNANVYHRNFAHVEDLARIGGPKQWRELGFRKDDAEAGVTLDQDYKFEFVARPRDDTEVYHHYTFAILQTQLSINSVTAVVGL